MARVSTAAMAAGLVALSCFAALVYTSRSGSARVALQQEDLYVWSPHQGKLTAMLINSKPAHVSQAREQQLAITESITDRPSENMQSRHDASVQSDASWAKQMLSMGGSYAEDKGRTNLVTAGYSNTHSGFSSAVPEERSGSGVYAFANLISHGGTARDDKEVGPARTQQLSETAAHPAAISTPSKTQPATRQVAKPGFTADVREDPARATTKAWDWAGDRQHGSKGAMLADSKPRAHVMHGESAAVVESSDTPEQKAWSWGSTAFGNGRHRAFDAAQARKDAAAAKQSTTAPKPAQKQKQLADFAMPKKAAGNSNESPRRARLAEARKAIVKLHRASLNYEHRHYQHAKRHESRNARKLTRRDDDLERDANKGAAAEFNDYGAVASLGIPSGANSAQSESESRGDGWGRHPAEDDKARESDFRARDPGARRRHARHRHEGDEAQDVKEATDEIFSGISEGDDDDSERRRGNRRASRGRRGRGGVIQTSAQIAAAEEASYQKGFENGIAAEQKALREGGRDSEREKRADALKRQEKRAKERKTAQLKAQHKVAREQSLADNTWDDADSDFQV
jgi:hypothetical protein